MNPTNPQNPYYPQMPPGPQMPPAPMTVPASPQPVTPTNFQPSEPTIPVQDIERAKQIVDKITQTFTSYVVGQDNLRTSLLVALLSGGHILLESVPGLAKTTAGRTLAESVRASFRRIQCTPDVLPSDIIGTQIYNYAKGTFETQLGPIHANFVLLDEINRSSAKTQSAMLEAMQERQTSIGGTVHKLPDPFLVLATQNPIEQEGTYELPEAQLDRFLLKEVLSYPSQNEEIMILDRMESGALDKPIKEADTVPLEDVQFLQRLVQKVYVDESLKKYIVAITAATRQPGNVISPDLARYVQYGASPRGSITLLNVARALALLGGRSYATPDDVKQLRHSALRHRLILNFEAIADNVHPEAIIDAIFSATPTP